MIDIVGSSSGLGSGDGTISSSHANELDEQAVKSKLAAALLNRGAVVNIIGKVDGADLSLCCYSVESESGALVPHGSDPRIVSGRQAGRGVGCVCVLVKQASPAAVTI